MNKEIYNKLKNEVRTHGQVYLGDGHYVYSEAELNRVTMRVIHNKINRKDNRRYRKFDTSYITSCYYLRNKLRGNCVIYSQDLQADKLFVRKLKHKVEEGI